MSSGEGRYGLYSQGSTGWSTLRYEEFQEDDVWGVLRGTEQVNPSGSTSVFNQSSSKITSRRLSSAARMIIPKSSSNSVIEPKIVQQHSAPVNIPDWSKIYGKKSSKNNNSSSWVFVDDDDSSDGLNNTGWDIDEEEEDEEEEELEDYGGIMIPPHEWIAKKLARSQISSFSVYEGVGRTLKGRDLKNVRNAILTKTGFLE